MSSKTFGFRYGLSGVHQARTMMFKDIEFLLNTTTSDAPLSEYENKIIEQNSLGKPTLNSRKLAFRHLKELYGLDPEIAIFRQMRRLWNFDGAPKEFLALCLALARDPFLRNTQDLILLKHSGQTVTREEMVKLIKEKHGGKHSEVSLKSFAQNINGTWTQALYLEGKAKKIRIEHKPDPIGMAYALFLGWIDGYRGIELLTSPWGKLCSTLPNEVEDYAYSASKRGIIVFRKVGEIIDIRFDGWLTEKESEMMNVAN